MILTRAWDESHRRGPPLRSVQMWYGEVGSAQLTSSSPGDVMKKIFLFAFWRDGKKKIDPVSERVEKHHPPCSPLRQDHLGKGKWCLAGCTVGVVALEKLAFFWSPPARSGRANIQRGLLQAAGLGSLPVDGFLKSGSCTPILPSSIPVLPIFTSHEWKPKWHLSIMATKSRTSNTLSPKWVFIMLCQEMTMIYLKTDMKRVQTWNNLFCFYCISFDCATPWKKNKHIQKKQTLPGPTSVKLQ